MDFDHQSECGIGPVALDKCSAVARNSLGACPFDLHCKLVLPARDETNHPTA